MKKGEYGFIDESKQLKLNISAAFIVVIAILSTVILAVYGTRSNYWIVIPIILALPFAKFLVSYLMVRPFRSMSKDAHGYVENNIKDMDHIATIYDATLASEDGVSFLDLVLLYDGNVYASRGYGNKKYSKEDITNYLKRIVKRAGYDRKVYVFEGSKETVDTFVKHMASHNADHEPDDKCTKNIRSAIINLGV